MKSFHCKTTKLVRCCASGLLKGAGHGFFHRREKSSKKKSANFLITSIIVQSNNTKTSDYIDILTLITLYNYTLPFQLMNYH